MIEMKKLLLEKREDLLRLVENASKKDIDENNIGDEADVASGSVEKELLFELNDNERSILVSIEAALRKIENNTFGLCENCRKKIKKERIKALPFARCCITCQSKVEM